MFKLLKNIKKWWWCAALLVLLVISKTFVDLLVPNLTSKVINLIPVNGIGDSTIIVPQMIMAGFIALGSVFGVLLLEFIISWLSAFLASRFQGEVRQQMFDKVNSLSYNDSSKYGTSSLITRTTNDVSQVGQLVTMLFKVFISAPITLIGAILLTLQVNVSLTYVFLCSIPIFLIFIGFIGMKVLPLFKVMQKRTDDLTLVSRESITGARVIKAFDNDKKEEERFKKRNKDITDVMTKANKTMSIAMPVVQFVLSITILGIILVFAIIVKNNPVYNPNLFGDLQKVIQYATKAMMAVLMMVMMFIMLPRAAVSAKRINEILAIKPVIVDGTEIFNVKNKTEIEFKNVTFQYDGAEQPAINNLSFKAHSGYTVAIIGSTGSGKSTVINLLERFLDVTSGEILVNGQNIKNIKLDDLRSLIGYVPQVPVIFSSTIYENISFGQNLSDNEVWEACDKACASEFIKAKDKGLKTELSDRGTNLSGGQKQRICIARAIARKSDILLFDDSFSALDFATDKQVRNNLKNIKESIKIIVAQRVSTIKDANLIIVLSDGEVCGQGTHKDLIASCEEYNLICSSQGVN